MVWNGEAWMQDGVPLPDDFPIHPGDTIVAVVRTPTGYGRRVGTAIEIRRVSVDDAVPAVYVRRECGRVIVAQPRDIECVATRDGDDVPVSAIIEWQSRVRRKSRKGR